VKEAAMRRIALIGCLMITAAHGDAQTPPAAASRFEVASVKPNTSGPASESGGWWRNGSVTITNMPARMLIITAYGLRPDRIVGGPSWIDSERFDVSARAPEGAPDTQLPAMLRTLLAERFKLVARTEIRDQPVYALVLARTDGRLGPNLKPSTECRKGGSAGGPASPTPPPQPGEPLMCGIRSTFTDATGGVIQGGATTLATLARALDGSTGRSVVDRTGLTGTFDVDLRFARMNLQVAPAADSGLPTLFTAVQEQLGLKLESQTGNVEFLVIDSIERATPD
jgi:uncharacterized protein (TIGR03435 family)